MRIAVLGSTGVVGRNLVSRLIEQGHQVRAGVHGAPLNYRTDAAVSVEVDIMDRASVLRFVAGCDGVINVASAIPRPGQASDWRTHDRIRREGTANLVHACSHADLVLVQQSVAMLHAADTDDMQSENDVLVGSGIFAAALNVERTVADWPGDWRIVRGGHLYGPGTGVDARWLEMARRGLFSISGDQLDWVSPIHVADLAAAFVTALLWGSPQSAWIAADDHPLRWRDLVSVAGDLTGAATPDIVTDGDRGLPSFRVSNAALKSLDWKPRYQSLASGLVATANCVVTPYAALTGR